MPNPTKIEFNCETGVETITEMTDEEIAQRKKDVAMYEAEKSEREAVAQAKAEAKASALAKLEALGLTEEEATALIS
jgi:hypothetical protein